MIARSCGMEAEGKVWEENLAVYGYLSMQVDFTVSAKVHCQFPVYVMWQRPIWWWPALCNSVESKKKSQCCFLKWVICPQIFKVS